LKRLKYLKYQEGNIMVKNYTLEYWIDDGWYVGRVREIPGIFSQGENLEELEENIKDAYSFMMAEEKTDLKVNVKTRDIALEIS
jgi:predicted RNase H-like HicB family nuclease